MKLQWENYYLGWQWTQLHVLDNRIRQARFMFLFGQLVWTEWYRWLKMLKKINIWLINFLVKGDLIILWFLNVTSNDRCNLQHKSIGGFVKHIRDENYKSVWKEWGVRESFLNKLLCKAQILPLKNFFFFSFWLLF